ncbi:MAG: VWA domain-containing protein, partial [bacterium]
IVRRREDPALLEWVGTRAISASVYPIPANGDKRIAISYQEVLGANGGVIKYVYPLKTEKVSATPLKECSIEININSAQPIRSIYSPTHNVTIKKTSETTALVSYSEKDTRPDRDLVLYYTVSDKDLGIDLLSYRDNQKGNGFFTLLAAPKVDLKADDIQAKDVEFVFDTSGSMAGDKIEQSKKALSFCLNNLNKGDRFNIITFSSDVRAWETTLQPVTPENVKRALDAVNAMRGNGGTDINSALRAALMNLGDRPAAETGLPVVIFLTDGQPTVGEQVDANILNNVTKINVSKARIFNFGVGEDYNVQLLDKLANGNNGFAQNVGAKENIEVKVSDFYARISTPLLTNLKIDWGTANVYDIFPKTLPDVYQGAQLVITARYAIKDTPVHTAITISGMANGKEHRYTYDANFPASAITADFVPRLWATRKIGYLEDQVRLNGATTEVVQEIIQLSKEYGILTEYTSFLVDLDTNPPVAGGDPRPLALRSSKDLAAAGSRVMNTYRDSAKSSDQIAQAQNRNNNYYANQNPSGYSSAVTDSVGYQAYSYGYGSGGAAGAAPTLGGAGVPTIKPPTANTPPPADRGLRNFNQRSFVQEGTKLTDINLKDAQKVIKVKQFSPAYFQLANADSNMAQYLSLSKEITVSLQDDAITVGTEGREAEFTPEELAKLTKQMAATFISI